MEKSCEAEPDGGQQDRVNTVERAQAASNSAAFQTAAQVGKKYAKFCIYAVEGAPPQLAANCKSQHA